MCRFVSVFVAQAVVMLDTTGDRAWDPSGGDLFEWPIPSLLSGTEAWWTLLESPGPRFLCGVQCYQRRHLLHIWYGCATSRAWYMSCVSCKRRRSFSHSLQRACLCACWSKVKPVPLINDYIMYIIYIYIHTYLSVYIYIYIYSGLSGCDLGDFWNGFSDVGHRPERGKRPWLRATSVRAHDDGAQALSVRNSCVSTLCPVVICPYSCISDWLCGCSPRSQRGMSKPCIYIYIYI